MNKHPEPQKICVRCVLPETLPGIRFDSEGVCHYCRAHLKKGSGNEEEKKRYRQKFQDLIATVKGLQSAQTGEDGKGSDQFPAGSCSYDMLMAYSGGKDSSYTLKILKQDYHLRILAVTFNHGFVSEQAFKNIETVTRVLGVDHLTVSPSPRVVWGAFQQSARLNLYPMKALERASSICNTCMNLVKSILLRLAIEMGIPLIGYGWSPGQAPIQSSVMKWNPSMVRQTQETIVQCLKGMMGKELDVFTLGERHFKLLEWESERYGGVFLYNIHPLAFLEYDEIRILEAIRELGWRDPKDTDPNSTNCLLNAFANQVHLERYGFHPYAFEIAGLVRGGYMSREDGLAKLSAPPDEATIRAVKEKLEMVRTC